MPESLFLILLYCHDQSSGVMGLRNSFDFQAIPISVQRFTLLKPFSTVSE
jgi:hypothetical protein